MRIARISTPALTCLAALVALTAAAGPAIAAPHIPGQLVIEYQPGTSGAERDAIRRAADVRSERFITADSQSVTVEQGRDVREAAAALESDPRVAHARPNYTAGTSEFVPNDPGRGGAGNWAELQWNFAGPHGIRVEQAWQNAIDAGSPGGKDVIVAVIDTGVAYRNSRNGRFRRSPDLGRGRFVAGYDFVRRNAFPYDRNGHGTFVAGTLAQQTDNGLGVTGIAYGARVMPVRVLNAAGQGDVATIARGIRFAARRGAKIINMSFEFSIGLTASQIPDVMSALRYANRKGTLMVAASGNGQESRVAYPARARAVMAVGATTDDGCVADYSNTGTRLSVVAPGGGSNALILNDPNCDSTGAGRYVFQYTFTGSNPRVFGLPAGYEGTSMAAPHVAGTAVLIVGEALLGEDPSPDALRSRIEGTARDLGASGYDTTYGYGLIDSGAATAPL